MIKFDLLKINTFCLFTVSVSNDLTKILFFKRRSNQIVIYDVNTSTWLNTFVHKHQVIDAHWVREGVIFLKARFCQHILWDYDKEIEITNFIDATINGCRFSKKSDFMIAQSHWLAKSTFTTQKLLI